MTVSVFFNVIQSIGTLITLASLFFIFQQIKLQTEQIKIQTSSNAIQSLQLINTRWNSESMMQSRYQVCINYLNKTTEMDGSSHQVGEFLEELGVYISLDHFPCEGLFETHSWYILHYYNILKKGMEMYVEKYEDPKLYYKANLLYNEMRKIEREGDHRRVGNIESDIDDFVEEELQALSTILKIERKKTQYQLKAEGK